MKLKSITFFYNEEALVPFYLQHYSWIDEILAIVTPGHDKTIAILEKDPRVTVKVVEFPNGLDDILKVTLLNEAIKDGKDDSTWQFVVDADEFVWPAGMPVICSYAVVRAYLKIIPQEVDHLVAKMWNVYRRYDDKDLDVNNTPVIMQRRHGISHRYTSGDLVRLCNKPCIRRTNSNVSYTPGQHYIFYKEFNDCQINHRSPWWFDGVHWSMADPVFCLKRRIQDRTERISKENQIRGLGGHFKGLNYAKVAQECVTHANDPQCF